MASRPSYRRNPKRFNSLAGLAVKLPGAVRAPPRHWESSLQMGMVRYFLIAVDPLDAKLISIPNGDVRDPVVQERLKLEGLCPGATDLLLVLPAARVCWVEVKIPAMPLYGVRRTDLSSDQKAFHAALDHFDQARAVIRSLDEWADLLERHQVRLKHRPLAPVHLGQFPAPSPR